MRLFLLIVLGAVSIASTVLAQVTEIDLLRNKFGKYAVGDPLTEKPKGLCACIDDDNPRNGHAGGVLFVSRTSQPDYERVVVRCMVLLGNRAGDIIEAQECSTWLPLSK